MAEYKKTSFNDALRYGRLSSAYSGAPTGKPGGYGVQGTYGMPRGDDGAAAEDYVGVFMRAAGLMYGAVRGMQDSMRGSAIGSYGGAAEGYAQCMFPDCPHHGAGMQKGVQYGGLEKKANEYNDSYGKARR